MNLTIKSAILGSLLDTDVWLKFYLVHLESVICATVAHALNRAIADVGKTYIEVGKLLEEQVSLACATTTLFQCSQSSAMMYKIHRRNNE